MAARNEVLAVQVERDRVELDRLRAEAAADAAEANLHRLLDLPPVARVEPAEPLEASARRRRPTSRPSWPRPQAGRAERKALAARVAAAEAVTGAERGARLPQVALTGGYTYANPNRDIVPPTDRLEGHLGRGRGPVAGASSTAGRRSANEARARAQADAAPASSCASWTGGSASRSRSARSSCAPPRRGSRSPSGASSRPRENRRVAGDRYREGVIPSSELLDAEVAHERAALARTEALAALRLAAAGLDRAVGR